MPLATIELTSADGATVAQFVPEAAMLCCSLQHRGDELLDSGRGVDAYSQHGKTMGIPLLYPWANRLAGLSYQLAGRSVTLPDDPARIPVDPNGLPIHGVVPGLLCFETERGEAGASVRGRLSWSREQLLELFPFTHELSIEATIGDGTLTIATTVSASAGDPVPVSFGFHPYLRIASRDSWHLQLPEAQHLGLDEQMIPTGELEPAPCGELPLAQSSWDDGYRLASQPARYGVSKGPRVQPPQPQREIVLEMQHGFPYSQIYAPPGKDFVCFEPMTAATNALRSGDGLTVLQPGDSYTAVFEVSARRM